MTYTVMGRNLTHYLRQVSEEWMARYGLCPSAGKIVPSRGVIANEVKQSLPETEIASSPQAPRNDRTLHVLMKSGSY
jgi:hypothetical protein